VVTVDSVRSAIVVERQIGCKCSQNPKVRKSFGLSKSRMHLVAQKLGQRKNCGMRLLGFVKMAENVSKTTQEAF